MSQIQLAIQANSQPADGKSAVTVQATVTDANNAAVAGAVVNFSATSGTLAQAQATTDANGQAVASLISTTPGPVTLTAILGDGTTASESSLYFVAVPASVDTNPLPAAPAATQPVPGTATAPDVDVVLARVKDLLALAGHDVEYVWDEVVAFAKKLA
jgi:adhesin/invasin